MPPKVVTNAGTGNVTLTGKNVIVLRKLLCSLDTKINYATLGRALGLNTPSNGRVALRSAITPLGVTVKDGSFEELIEEEEEEAAAADGGGSGPAAKSGSNKRKRGGAKAEEGGATKKAKKSAAVGATEDVEEDAEDAEDADGTDTSK